MSVAKKPRLSLTTNESILHPIDPLHEVIHSIEDGTELNKFKLLLEGGQSSFCSLSQLELFKARLTMKEVAKRRSPLVVAVQNNRTEILEYFLTNFVVNIEQETTTDEFSLRDSPVTALLIASYLGNIECVKLLIEKGATTEHMNPLLIAARKNRYDVCKYLVDNNANIEWPLEEETSPLIQALYHKSRELVEYFVDKGADVNRKVYRGNTPLHLVRSVKIADILIKAGARSCTNDYGWTPAVVAALNDDATLMYHLIDALQCGVKEQYDCYCLQAAILMQYTEDISQAGPFMRKAVGLRLKNPNCFSHLPRSHEVYNGIQEPSTIAEYLTTVQSKTRMCFVCSIYCERILGRNHRETMWALRDCLDDTLSRNDYDRCFQFCHRLLDFDLSPAVYDDYCFAGDFLIVVESVLEMVDNGYIQNLQPLFQCGLEAINKGCEPDGSLIGCVVRLVALWIKVADNCFQDRIDREREHTLIANAVQEIIRTCEKNNISVLIACLQNVSDYVEVIGLDIPLHKVLALFLDHGCSIHCQDKHGNFPLHLVSQLPDYAAIDCVSTLLEYGAHFDAVNYKNQTALEVDPYEWEYINPTYFNETFDELESFQFQHTTLQCLAARVILQHNIKYTKYLPRRMVEFVSWHSSDHRNRCL